MPRYIKNPVFDRMGEKYAPIINPDHFLGHTAFDVSARKVKYKSTTKYEQNGMEEVITLNLEGFDKGDIQLFLNDDILMVEAERKMMEQPHPSKIIKEEYGLKSIEHVFVLSEKIDPENLTAKFDDGKLRITINRDGVKSDNESIEVEVMEG